MPLTIKQYRNAARRMLQESSRFGKDGSSVSNFQEVDIVQGTTDRFGSGVGAGAWVNCDVWVNAEDAEDEKDEDGDTR